MSRLQWSDYDCTVKESSLRNHDLSGGICIPYKRCLSFERTIQGFPWNDWKKNFHIIVSVWMSTKHFFDFTTTNSLSRIIESDENEKEI